MAGGYRHWTHGSRWAAYTAYAVLGGQLAGNVPPSPPAEALPPAAYRQISRWHKVAPARAASEAYWLPNRLAGIVPPDLVASSSTCEIDLPIISPRRATPSAYDMALRPPPPEAVEALPEGVNRRLLPERATPSPRAAVSAYWIDNRIAGNVPPPPIEALPPTAYRTIVPQRTYAPARAATDAYWIDTSSGQNILTGQVTPPEATWRTLQPDRAPGPLRASESAYWIDNRLATPALIEDLPASAYRTILPERGPAPLRAGSEAYWLPNRLAGIVPPTPPEALPAAAYRELLPERAPTARRAPEQAYWIDTSFLQNILTGRVEPPDATWKTLLPARAAGSPRAGNEAYWIANRIAGNVPPPPFEALPEAVNRIVLAQRPRAAERAAESAYWIDNRLVTPALVPAEDLPSGQRVLLPARPRAAERTATDAYWLPNRLEGIIPPTPILADRRGTATLASEAVLAVLSDSVAENVGYGGEGYGEDGYGLGRGGGDAELTD